ncbi:N-acetylneuraminate synthase family protein [bacterium]|nr:N-acetylneuraminate synthase family protein [bacterium]
MNEIIIDNRKISTKTSPFIIAEIGINHHGNVDKAIKMIDAAAKIGCECVKFQCHILEDEMSSDAKNVIPGNTDQSIWEVMEQAVLTREQEIKIKEYTEKKGMIYLSTPFSRAAAKRLNQLGVKAFKIGSGECNNYPLIEHISRYGKPIILSTGMNSIESVQKSVNIMEKKKVSYALLHCTSIYPTPYDKVRLGCIKQLQTFFPTAVIGLSDHSIGNYTCYGAVALGASIIEKHFTCDKTWPGPDISLSITPDELKRLIQGCNAIHQALGGTKEILPEEQPTIDFAYSSVVAIKDICKGEILTYENLWVRRPGTGDFLAESLECIIGGLAKINIKAGSQIRKEML